MIIQTVVMSLVSWIIYRSRIISAVFVLTVSYSFSFGNSSMLLTGILMMVIIGAYNEIRPKELRC